MKGTVSEAVVREARFRDGTAEQRGDIWIRDIMQHYGFTTLDDFFEELLEEEVTPSHQEKREFVHNNWTATKKKYGALALSPINMAKLRELYQSFSVEYDPEGGFKNDEDRVTATEEEIDEFLQLFSPSNAGGAKRRRKRKV